MVLKNTSGRCTENRRGQGKWPQSNYQSSRNHKRLGQTTSYHYIKLTWEKFVFHNGIYSDSEYLGGLFMFDALEHGKMLKLFRKKAKMTQEDIADELNITQSCVSKYESGRKVLDLSTFLKWINITNSEIPAAAMLFGMDTVNAVTQLMPMVPMFVGGLFNWML